MVWSESHIRREQRATLLKQHGCVIWLTGLSGSGKSTIARAVESRLVQDGRFAYVLDGDNVRHGLCGDLGFSDDDRRENIRRVGEVAALFADAGAIALAAFISPFRSERALARQLCGSNPFVEVHVATDLAECERRDVKGFYAKARAGEIASFTGITSPYEPPESSELTIDTTTCTVGQAADRIVSYIASHDIIADHEAASGSGI